MTSCGRLDLFQDRILVDVSGFYLFQCGEVRTLYRRPPQGNIVEVQVGDNLPLSLRGGPLPGRGQPQVRDNLEAHVWIDHWNEF